MNEKLIDQLENERRRVIINVGIRLANSHDCDDVDCTLACQPS